MKNISTIQVIIISVAGLAILVAVFIFAFSRSGGGNTQLSDVVAWGTVEESYFTLTIENIRRNTGKQEYLSHLTYIEKNPDTFDQELLSAIAEGAGPDLIILRENQIIENEGRITKIPYESFDLRTFNETYIDEARLLATEGGLIGMPFMINPLVMYYNRDILNAEGIASPPETWTEVLSHAPGLTISDSSFNISRSAVSLGDYGNINHAKEIVWALIMQAGNDVVIRDESTIRNEGKSPYFSILDEKLNFSLPPAHAALNFFTQFSNASRNIYSWNRSLPQSDDYFLAGDLAMYIGYASELPLMRVKNPNLNFDIATLPQSRRTEDGGKKVTYGQMHFISIPRNSINVQSAFATMGILSGREFQTELSLVSGLPPIRRDLLSTTDPKSSYDEVFYKSALISRGVMEPGKGDGDRIVRGMVESILSGENDIEDAIREADLRLNKELNNE